MPSFESTMTYQYRLATTDDAEAIFAVLEEVAPEIPLDLNLPGRKELVFERIQTGETWIALDPDHQIVGFLLAEPDKLERFRHNNRALDLSYGGVRTGHRGQRIFPALMEKMKEKGVPLTATVKHSNKSKNMVGQLLDLGFTKVGSMQADQDDLRWAP